MRQYSRGVRHITEEEEEEEEEEEKKKKKLIIGALVGIRRSEKKLNCQKKPVSY